MIAIDASSAPICAATIAAAAFFSTSTNAPSSALRAQLWVSSTHSLDSLWRHSNVRALRYRSGIDQCTERTAVHRRQVWARATGRVGARAECHDSPRLRHSRRNNDRWQAAHESNPYRNAGPSVRPEIWASGLRNPWRFSFDPLTRTRS